MRRHCTRFLQTTQTTTACHGTRRNEASELAIPIVIAGPPGDCYRHGPGRGVDAAGRVSAQRDVQGVTSAFEAVTMTEPEGSTLIVSIAQLTGAITRPSQREQ